MHQCILSLYTMQYSTVHYNTLPHNTVQYITPIHHSAMLYNTHVKEYNTINDTVY